jgi:hypothetical protein
MRGPELALFVLFRCGRKVVRSVYMQYKRNRASSLSIPSLVRVGREGGERCMPAE